MSLVAQFAEELTSGRLKWPFSSPHLLFCCWLWRSFQNPKQRKKTNYLTLHVDPMFFSIFNLRCRTPARGFAALAIFF